jgi:hypothetical protein
MLPMLCSASWCAGLLASLPSRRETIYDRRAGPETALAQLRPTRELAGDARPWQPDGVNVLSDKLVSRPRLAPVA